jgi:hypothetical protein
LGLTRGEPFDLSYRSPEWASRTLRNCPTSRKPREVGAPVIFQDVVPILGPRLAQPSRCSKAGIHECVQRGGLITSVCAGEGSSPQIRDSSKGLRYKHSKNPRPLKTAKDGAASFVIVPMTKRLDQPRYTRRRVAWCRCDIKWCWRIAGDSICVCFLRWVLTKDTTNENARAVT